MAGFGLRARVIIPASGLESSQRLFHQILAWKLLCEINSLSCHHGRLTVADCADVGVSLSLSFSV